MTAAEIKRAFDDLNAWLSASRVAHAVVFSAPIAHAELDAAARRLGVTFPPSYARFVTEHGTFTISGAITGRGEGNDTALLSPRDAVTQTDKYRRWVAESDDADSIQILQDAIVFCEDPEDEYVHLFVISSADAAGEMNAREYNYQDPATSDPWFEGDGSFATTMSFIIETVRSNAIASLDDD
ncbi:MAG: SMI1/KNR4 family protein [Kofleriaceae bacterium]